MGFRFEAAADPAAAAKDWLQARLLAASARPGRFTLLVSGGRSPARILTPLLAQDAIAWDRLDVLASDERLVPPDHPDSTQGLIQGLFAAAGRPLHYAGTAGEVAPNAALAAWRASRARLAWPPVCGLIGIGGDGHTASLFPGDGRGLAVDLQDMAVAETAPHRHGRLTLGLAALAAAPLALVAADADKLAALVVIARDPQGWALGRLAGMTDVVVFYLDG